MKSKPYIVRTSYGYIVGLPQWDGEVTIEFDKDTDMMYLSKEDVQLILERFD